MTKSKKFLIGAAIGILWLIVTMIADLGFNSWKYEPESFGFWMAFLNLPSAVLVNSGIFPQAVNSSAPLQMVILTISNALIGGLIAILFFGRKQK